MKLLHSFAFSFLSLTILYSCNLNTSESFQRGNERTQFEDIGSSEDNTSVELVDGRDSITLPQYRDRIILGTIKPSDDNLTFAILDSALSTNPRTRKAYFEAFMKLLELSDGALSEVIPLYATRYVNDYPENFFQLYENDMSEVEQSNIVFAIKNEDYFTQDEIASRYKHQKLASQYLSDTGFSTFTYHYIEEEEFAKVQSGNYTYTLGYVEWDNTEIGGTVELDIRGEYIRVFKMESSNIEGDIGEVLAEGLLRKHESGTWVIVHSEEELNTNLEDGGNFLISLDLNSRIIWFF